MASAGNRRTYKLNMIVPNPAYSQFILQLKNPTTQFALTNMSDFNATPPHADQSQADCSSWLNILALLLQGILIIAMLWLGQRAFQLLQGEIQSQHDNLESLQTWVGNWTMTSTNYGHRSLLAPEVLGAWRPRRN